MIAAVAQDPAIDARAMLHNVCNALNPVSTILGRGVSAPPAADRAMLERAVAELSLGHGDAERRVRLATFVLAGLAAEADARAALRADLAIARDAMTQVLDILGDTGTPRPATCDVAALLHHAAAVTRSVGTTVTVDADADAVPAVLGSAVMLGQVLGNLFTNATDAGARAIVARVSLVGDRVVVRIGDSGEGFDPPDAGALFRDGVSTRSHRTGGLGLAWSARALAAMGGTLTLASDGPGKGAIATLTLRAA